jgi:hypothetical protein
VDAANTGRLPATVTGWSIAIAGNAAVYTNPTDPRNPAVMHRLESHANQWWWATASDIEWYINAFEKKHGAGRVHARGKVDFGGRRTVESSNTLKMVNGQFVASKTLRARLLARVRRIAGT